MRRAIALVILSFGALLFLTGCNQPIESVKEDAKFAKVCTESGGHIWYDGFNGLNCSFLEGS